jgi:hypothetical protein
MPERRRGKHPRGGSRSETGRWLEILTVVRIVTQLVFWFWNGDGPWHRS